jgi:hypothetical protein
MPNFHKYTQIAVINNSTSVSDTDGSTMVEALNMLLPTFCKDWFISDVSAVYIPRGATALPTDIYYMYLMDNTDVPNAVAYHDFTACLPYGKVFAKTVLDNNGVMMYEPTLKKPTVAQALSHEVFELLVDPLCNAWWMNNNTGILYASEVCDPVQSNIILINLPNDVKVGLSDWIMPAWNNIQNTTGPFNRMNTLTAPFQIKNGYAIVIKNSKVTSVYGDTVNPTTYSHSKLGERFSKRMSCIPPVSAKR